MPSPDFVAKLRSAFDGFLVGKNPRRAAQIADLKLPSYMRDFMYQRFGDDEGNVDEQGMREFVEKVIPSKDSWKLFMDRMMSDGETVKILARISVTHSVDRGVVTFRLPDLGLENNSTIIEPYDWSKIPDESKAQVLCAGDVWGLLTLKYKYPETSKNGNRTSKGKIKLVDFRSFTPYVVDPEYYKSARESFEFDEWLDLLLGAVDYNSDGYPSNSAKLAMLSRLLPFVEPRLNLIEFAPKGTGKSYLYGQVSRFGWLMSGGIVTRAKLFYDMSQKRDGLITTNDFVVLDEVQTVKFGDQDEMRGALKSYLEQGALHVGPKEISANAGLILSGNISSDRMNERTNMFEELPTFFHESALIERFHGFIRGWQIPTMKEDMKASGLALNSEYFTSILHELRTDLSYASIVDEALEIPPSANTRDVTAIRRITTALVKLLFPNVRSVADLDAELFKTECLNRALEMRQIIKYQLGILDPAEYRGRNVPNVRARTELMRH